MRKPSDRGRPVLPRDELPCVWMTAGLLAYRLCDREFDCERCPLDAALRGPSRRTQPRRVAAWDFPADRLYHPGHTWVRTQSPGRLRCGVDAFAARLLGHTRGIVLPAERGQLTHGQVACWLEDESELVPLRSPAGGTVVERNARAQRDPGLVAAAPYGEGWLFEMVGELPENSGLLTGDQIGELSQRQLGRLRRRAARYLARGREAVGATAADGGEALVDLRRMLGAERFRKLIFPYLG